MNVNLLEEELPDTLSGKVTSLAIETGQEHDLEDLFRNLCRRVGETYGSWVNLGGAGVRTLVAGEGIAFVNFGESGARIRGD